MTQTAPDVKVLGERVVSAFPTLDANGRRLSLQLYRELARGAPVAPSALADRADMRAEEVIRQLQGWPGR